jgi:hypothetical protein
MYTVLLVIAIYQYYVIGPNELLAAYIVCSCHHFWQLITPQSKKLFLVPTSREVRHPRSFHSLAFYFDGTAG